MFFTDFVQYKTFDEVPSPSPLNFLDSLFLACAGLNVLFYWMGSFDNDILSYCVNKWINCLSQWWYSVPYIIILSFMKKLRPWPFTVMKSFFCLKGTWPQKKRIISWLWGQQDILQSVPHFWEGWDHTGILSMSQP